MKNRLLLATITIMLSACSLFFGDSKRDSLKDSRYKIQFNDSGWKKIDPNGSDIAYSHEDGDVLLANSFCHEFQHEPLEKLAQKTLQSINQFKLEKGQTIKYQNREAYEAIGTGHLDGVDIKIKIRNYRRDHCYYDFVLISTELNETRLKSFDHFTEAIEF